jgi:hypothetical protein
MNSFAGLNGLPLHRCLYVTSPPQVDGDLQKEVWRAIAPEPLLDVTGRSADCQPTELRVYYTDSHLYVAFHAKDRDIWGTYSERDTPLYDEEVVEVFLSPTGDVRHYYEFEVSPHNVVFDAKVYSPDLHRGTMRVDTSWDCPDLQTAVRVHGTVHDSPPSTERRVPSTISAWSVEIAIPFAAFPEVLPPKPGDVWRANFYRIDRAERPEFTAWSPTLEDPPNFHVPERFGHLVFEG